MRVLIVGASGRTGRAATTRALLEGHSVTAFCRGAERMEIRDPRLRGVSGDVRDPTAVEAVVRDQDAVICILGIPVTRRPVTMFSEGTANIVRAMRTHGVRRLIAVTGIGAGDSRGHGGFFFDHIVLPLLLRTIYEDKNRQETVIRASDLDWVIVRPGFLIDGPASGNYLVLNDLRRVTAGRIARADVAGFLVRQLVDTRYLRESPLVTQPDHGPPLDTVAIRAVQPTSVAAAIVAAVGTSLRYRTGID